MSAAASAASERPGKPRPRWLSVLSAGVVTLAVVMAAIFGSRADGQPVQDLDLGDGSVWVSGGRGGDWAVVDTGAHAFGLVIEGEPSSGRAAQVRRADVLQDGRHVVGMTAAGEFFGIDSDTGERGESITVELPTSGRGELWHPVNVVDLRGGTVAIVDWSTGEVRARRINDPSRVDLEGLSESEPLARLGGRTAVAVDVEGNVKAVSAEAATVVDIPVSGEGFGTPESTQLDLQARDFADITAVGDRWVVMDSAGTIFHEGDPSDPEEIQDSVDPNLGIVFAALQQPGEDAEEVAVQSIGSASFVGLGTSSGGDDSPTILAALRSGPGMATDTRLSRPAVVDGCLAAAWGERHLITYAQSCEPGEVPAAGLSAQGDLPRRNGVAVRVNRGQLLLNDLDTGRVYDPSLTTASIRIDTWPKGAVRDRKRPDD